MWEKWNGGEGLRKANGDPDGKVVREKSHSVIVHGAYGDDVGGRG